jgi:hypothetical protein
MAEWSKAHAWKVCNRQKRFMGSNPILSAIENKSRGEDRDFTKKMQDSSSLEVLLFFCERPPARSDGRDLFSIAGSPPRDHAVIPIPNGWIYFLLQISFIILVFIL